MKMGQQFFGYPGVFSRNNITSAQYLKRTQGNILQIADRRCDHIKFRHTVPLYSRCCNFTTFCYNALRKSGVLMLQKTYCACCTKQQQYLSPFYLYAVCDNCRKRLCAIACDATSKSRTCMLFYIRCHGTFLAKTEKKMPDEFLQKLSTKHLNNLARLCIAWSK